MTAPLDTSRESAAKAHERTLDIDLRQLLEALEGPPVEPASISPGDRRKSAGELFAVLRGSTAAGLEASLDAVDDVIDTKDGPVRVRTYRHKDAVSSPESVVVYLHGGGWVAGSVDAYDVDVRRLAVRTNLTVVSVDYRLAPEHPFPAGLRDCIGVIEAIGADARYGAVGVAGDSAGGNLALESAIALAASPIRVAALLLLYPVVDRDAIGNASYRENANGYLLTSKDMAYYWDVYDPSGEYSAVVRQREAFSKDLPATVITTAGFDPLHDEGASAAKRLIEADVQVTYLPEPSLIHGYQQMVSRSPAAERALDRAYEAFRIALTSSLGE